MSRKLWWVVGGIAAVALLALWIVEQSPVDDSFKSVAKRTVATGAALGVTALLVATALLGLPAPFGLVAAAGVLVGSGAWAVMKHSVSGALNPAPCPEGAGTTMVDGELWCTCPNDEGGVSIFPAGSTPPSSCV